jgi:hypothetical protein
MTTARKLTELLLEILIVTCQLREALQSLSNENGVSSVIGMDRTEQDPFIGPLHLLTSLHATSDFCLWGYVKDKVYQPPMSQSLRERISQATANVGESQLHRTREELEFRVHGCRVTNGAHIQRVQINFTSFLVVFKLFHVCVCNRFERTIISYHPNR